MKYFLAALVLWSSFLTVGLAQEDADNKYLAIYGQLQEADSLLSGGQMAEALAAYQTAQSQLLAFKQVYPNWDSEVVDYRLGDLEGKIKALKTQVPAAATNAVAATVPGANPPQSTAPPVVAPNPEEDVLQRQLQSLRDDNANLQAKLQEALSLQPSTVDASALAKANDQIRELMKQNDLLRVSQHPGETAKPDAEVARLQALLKISEKTCADQQASIARLTDENQRLQAAFEDAQKTNSEFLTRLRNENQRLQGQLDALRQNPSPAEAQAATDQELARLKSAVEQALVEKSALEERIKGMTMDLVHTDQSFEASLKELKNQRDDLAQKLKDSTAVAPAPQSISVTPASPTDQIIRTNPAPVPIVVTQAVEVPSSIAVTPATNPEPAPKVAAFTASTPSAPLDTTTVTPPSTSITQSAPQAASPRSETPVPITAAPQANSLKAPATNVIAQAKTNEDQAAPTPAPAPAVAAPPTPSIPTPQVAAAEAELTTSAQRHFANHELDLAEADYQKIIGLDPANAIALANLAAIELDENKLDSAEQHITAALQQSPNDAFNVAMRGKIEFSRKEYDQALADLNHAAELDPANPETENYLGLTLNQMGQSDAAEAALNKAIKLNPNYAPAHNNLAVVYMSENPPSPQLARWHYEKALAAGQPRNPELEKLLAQKGAAVSAGQ